MTVEFSPSNFKYIQGTSSGQMFTVNGFTHLSHFLGSNIQILIKNKLYVNLQE